MLPRTARIRQALVLTGFLALATTLLQPVCSLSTEHSISTHSSWSQGLAEHRSHTARRLHLKHARDGQPASQPEPVTGSQGLDQVGPALCSHPDDEFRSRCILPYKKCPPFPLHEVRHCKLPGTVYQPQQQTGQFSGVYSITEQPFDMPDPLAPAWYFVPLRVGTMLEADAMKTCEGRTTFSLPVVYAFRDEPTLWHVVAVQLLPMFAALRTFGLEDAAVQMIFIDDKRESLAEDKRWFNGFKLFYDQLSGAEVLEGGDLPDVVCTGPALVGVNKHVVPLHIKKRTHWTEVTVEQKDLVRNFASWMLRKHELVPRELTGDNILLTLIVRAPGEDRGRLLRNPKEVVTWARDMGIQVQVIDLGGLTIKQQLQAISETSILMAVHGAALTWLAMLPKGAVVVELKPYKFTEAYTHFDIYSNWALLAQVSHIVWSNKNPKHTSIGNQFVDDYKNHNIYLPRTDADTILTAALDLVKTPINERPYLEGSVFLNEPTPVDFTSHINMG